MIVELRPMARPPGCYRTVLLSLVAVADVLTAASGVLPLVIGDVVTDGAAGLVKSTTFVAATVVVAPAASVVAVAGSA